MIDISELEVFFINVGNYLDNPKAKECFEENCKRLKGAKIKVLSNNSEQVNILYSLLLKSTENNSREKFLCYFCDYVKFFHFLNTDSKYCLYIDLDTIIDKNSIDFILNNPNNYYIEHHGILSILYSSKDNLNKFFEVFNYMMEIGYSKYCENFGDKILYEFFDEKNKILFYEKNYGISWKKIMKENKNFSIQEKLFKNLKLEVKNKR